MTMGRTQESKSKEQRKHQKHGQGQKNKMHIIPNSLVSKTVTLRRRHSFLSVYEGKCGDTTEGFSSAQTHLAQAKVMKKTPPLP